MYTRRCLLITSGQSLRMAIKARITRRAQRVVLSVRSCQLTAKSSSKIRINPASKTTSMLFSYNMPVMARSDRTLAEKSCSDIASAGIARARAISKPSAAGKLQIKSLMYASQSRC